MHHDPYFVWRARNSLKDSVRRFFTARNFLEVDTPIVVSCPGSEVHLDYFATSWIDYHRRSKKYWLRSSPELHLKQIMAMGNRDIFQMAPCFRNGGERSAWHHPEFLLLEWYQGGNDFEGFIAQTYELMLATREDLRGLNPENRPSLALPQTRLPLLSVQEAFRQFAGIELIDQDPELASQARSRGVRSIAKTDDFETAYFKILLEKVEPLFENIPAIALYNYPPSQAALANIENGWAQRFEIYVHGVELCNGFQELLDLRENQARMRDCNKQRLSLTKEVTDEDEGFWQALARGLPPCCGNALGLDRWLALLLGEKNLDRVIPFRTRLFPTA